MEKDKRFYIDSGIFSVNAEQTNSWEELLRLNWGKTTPVYPRKDGSGVYAVIAENPEYRKSSPEEHLKAVDFMVNVISKTISQEKEKWIEKIKEHQEMYKPAYEEVDAVYIRALQWAINLLQK